MTPSTTTSPVLRARAARLHTACAHRGLHLRDGAAEQFLTERTRTVAAILGISHGQAMRRYLTDDTIQALVDVIADGANRLETAIDTASPLLLLIPDAARIVAALGQVACWAAVNTDREPWHTIAVTETAGTMITRWALAIDQAHASNALALVAADTVVHTRHTLATMADKLSSGAWNTPPGPDDDQQQANLRLRDAVIRDLALLA